MRAGNGTAFIVLYVLIGLISDKVLAGNPQLSLKTRMDPISCSLNTRLERLARDKHSSLLDPFILKTPGHLCVFFATLCIHLK
jgi:hypothetical protein